MFVEEVYADRSPDAYSAQAVVGLALSDLRFSFVTLGSEVVGMRRHNIKELILVRRSFVTRTVLLRGIPQQEHLIGAKRVYEDESRVNECTGLIWSDRVNTAQTVRLFLSLLFSFPEDRASSSRSSFERRLISLIFAGRNRIIMIRRELPLTVIASPVEPVA